MISSYSVAHLPHQFEGGPQTNGDYTKKGQRGKGRKGMSGLYVTMRWALISAKTCWEVGTVIDPNPGDKRAFARLVKTPEWKVNL
jgi:hypothetical protein